MRQQVKRDGVLQTDLPTKAVAKKTQADGKARTASTSPGTGMTTETVTAPENTIAPRTDIRALNEPEERVAGGSDSGEVAHAASEPDIGVLCGKDAQPATKVKPPTKLADGPKERNRRDHTGVAKMGEDLAALWLRRHGYKIIVRNWRSGRFCEIDIVARNADGLLVFVEVKTRRLKAGPTPTLKTPNSSACPDKYWTQQQAFESLDWRKRRKLVIAARSYIGRNHLSSDSCRLDAMIITYKSVMQEAEELRLDGVSVFHVPAAFSEI